jgi:hypothetical protein
VSCRVKGLNKSWELRGVSPSVTHASPVLYPPIGARAGCCDKPTRQQATVVLELQLVRYMYTYRTQSIFQDHLLLHTSTAHACRRWSKRRTNKRLEFFITFANKGISPKYTATRRGGLIIVDNRVSKNWHKEWSSPIWNFNPQAQQQNCPAHTHSN